MPAWELYGSYVEDPGDTVTQTTVVSGDSFQIRNFPPVNPAYLISIIRQGALPGYAQVKSPLLHDNVKGIHAAYGESPAEYLVPGGWQQPVRPQDTLTVWDSGAGSDDYDIVGWSIYFSNLPGSAARLFSPAVVMPNVKYIVGNVVACTNAAAPSGGWTDTPINNTDNLLHANTDYAVLGYQVDVVTGLVAVKGIDTGNLRVGGTGKLLQWDTTEYFVRMSNKFGLPMIPVINSANAPSTYVSTLDTADGATPNVTLILAEMATPLPGTPPGQ